ncbi:hypothetical protein G7Y79_00001g004370 [Physcia stellaris]|nr:hypothetical protein G7Y79_00001g004370 [Physcia stellaris]
MAANQWRPAELLSIGYIDINNSFQCVGFTDKKCKCTNKLNKDCRIEASDILRRISTMDTHYDDFDEILRELATVLLCTKSRHREKCMHKVVEKWKAAIKEHGDREFARRGGDTVMGEASDTQQYLRDKVADLEVRIRRLDVSDAVGGSSTKRYSRHLNNKLEDVERA